MAVLARLRLADPDAFARLRASPEIVSQQVPGATPADVAQVAGDLERAAEFYLKDLVAGRGRPSTWGGYALALTGAPTMDTPTSSSAALLNQLELVSAVWHAVARTMGKPAATTELAAWLTG
jgi:hypothetical protein